MKSLPISVYIVSFVLLVNVFMAVIDGPAWAIWPLFLAGPFLMVWMVLHVLKDTSVPMRDLEGDEHWGYQDRPDLRPAKDLS